jgi:hypothetical protein
VEGRGERLITHAVLPHAAWYAVACGALWHCGVTIGGNNQRTVNFQRARRNEFFHHKEIEINMLNLT